MRELARAALLLAPAVHAQFQFEIPPDMFGQMGGGGHFGGQRMGGQRQRRGGGGGESVPVGITNEFDWLKGTEWNWNNWRNIRFDPDGTFDAPTPDCQQHGKRACKWSTDDQTVYIQWGEAGLHKVKPTAMEPKEGTHLRGTRVKDREKCDAAFVRKEERDEDIDMYEVLGITDEATSAEVKKAYRRLSLKYHPDKCAGNVMNEKKGEEEPCDVAMNRVNLAYETLGDEDSRILYDTGGLEAVKEMKAEDERGGGGGGMDPFSMLFGGGGGGGGGRGGRNSKRGADAQIELGVTLEDMYNGNDVETTIKRRTVCRGCSGKTDGKCATCGRCPSKTRMVQRQMGNMIVQQEEEVPSKEKCKNEETTLKATVERGMDGGAEIKFPRMSEQSPGQIPGDVVMVLKQKKHRQFSRDGNDLHMDMTITLKEALLGFSRKVGHLDSHEVTVKQTKVTTPGEVKRIKGEGMPQHNFPSEFGDLFVKFSIKMPKELTDAQRQAIEANF